MKIQIFFIFPLDYRVKEMIWVKVSEPKPALSALAGELYEHAYFNIGLPLLSPITIFTIDTHFFVL